MQGITVADRLWLISIVVTAVTAGWSHTSNAGGGAKGGHAVNSANALWDVVDPFDTPLLLDNEAAADTARRRRKRDLGGAVALTALSVGAGNMAGEWANRTKKPYDWEPLPFLAYAKKKKTAEKAVQATPVNTTAGETKAPPKTANAAVQAPAPAKPSDSGGRPLIEPKKEDKATQTPPPKENAATQTFPPKKDAATQTPPPKKDAATQTPPPKKDAATQTPSPKKDAATQTPPPKKDAATQTEPVNSSDDEDDDDGGDAEPEKEKCIFNSALVAPGFPKIPAFAA